MFDYAKVIRSCSWLKNPKPFRIWFVVLLGLCVVTYWISDEMLIVFVFYTFCIVAAAIAFWNKPLWVLLLLCAFVEGIHPFRRC